MALGVWQATIVSEITGLPVAGALITVNQAGTEISANLFVDRAGDGPISNPAASNPRGFVRFYCTPGRYDIVATYGVDESESWNDVVILEDASAGGEIVDDDNNLFAPVSPNTIGSGASYNLISAGDGNSIGDFGSNNVILGGHGISITSTNTQNTILGSHGMTVDGSYNFASASSGTGIAGNNNVILSSSSSTIEGDDNLLFNSPGQTLTDVNSSSIFSTNGITATGTNNRMILASADGVTVDWTSKCGVLGTDSASIIESDKSAVMFSTASCTITFSNSTVIQSSVGVTINNSDRSHVMSTSQASIDGFDNVTIMSSQNVIARKKNTVVLGYGPSAPNVDHIKIELDAETGDIYAVGEIDAGSVKIGGETLVVRKNNLIATTNPTVNDDITEGYVALSNWVNTVTNEIYTCISNADGAANWQLGTLTFDQLGNVALLNANTVGQNLIQLANPSAISFFRVNADNTISTLTAAAFKTALALGTMADQNANAIAATGGSISGLSSLGVSGDITITGTTRRILADFGNSTISNRTIFQSSGTNSPTRLTSLPNGTATTCAVEMYSNSDPTNASGARVVATSSDVRLESIISGSGSYLPLSLYNNGSAKLTIPATGNITTLTGIDITGNLTFSASASKILAPMSDATVSNNLTIQSSVVNGFTVFNIAPNGSSVISGFNTFANSDIANGGYIGISSQTSDYRLSVGALGSSVLRQLTIRMGSTIAQAINITGDVGFGVNTPTTECKLQVSNGIKVGNTANSNTDVFDWYEEGSFTPVAVGGTLAGVGTYTVQSGNYTRKGNTVTFRIAIGWSAHTGTGNLIITGLPFTSASSGAPVPSSVYCDGLVVGAGKTPSSLISSSQTQITLRALDMAGGAASLIAMDSSVSVIDICGTYFV